MRERFLNKLNTCQSPKLPQTQIPQETTPTKSAFQKKKNEWSIKSSCRRSGSSSTEGIKLEIIRGNKFPQIITSKIWTIIKKWWNQ